MRTQTHDNDLRYFGAGHEGVLSVFLQLFEYLFVIGVAALVLVGEIVSPHRVAYFVLAGQVLAEYELAKFLQRHGRNLGDAHAAHELEVRQLLVELRALDRVVVYIKLLQHGEVQRRDLERAQEVVLQVQHLQIRRNDLERCEFVDLAVEFLQFVQIQGDIRDFVVRQADDFQVFHLPQLDASDQVVGEVQLLQQRERL